VQIDGDGRFVESSLNSRDIPPSPAVARAAARIAGLVKHWDDATYDAVLAPAVPKPQMQALFDKLRVLHKACTVGAPLGGDGGSSAVVTLACETDGPLRLSLAVAAPGERVIRLTIDPLLASRSTGRCPER
jgi:hypothetical protein